MNKTLLSLLAVIVSACGTPTEDELSPSTCIYEPVGYCEVVDKDTSLWYIWESDARLNQNDRDLLRRVGVMTCAECGRQSDVYACEKHNIEVHCDEIE